MHIRLIDIDDVYVSFWWCHWIYNFGEHHHVYTSINIIKGIAKLHIIEVVYMCKYVLGHMCICADVSVCLIAYNIQYAHVTYVCLNVKICMKVLCIFADINIYICRYVYT